MSVTHDTMPPPNPGHWQASDGNWYPPEAHPGYRTMAPPSPIYVQPQAKNGMAVAGFVCALIGVLLGLVPILAMPALILGVLGVVFGSVAWKRAVRAQTSKGMAVAASLLGVLALVLSIIGFVIVANVLKSPISIDTPSASKATPVKIEGATFASDYEGKPVIVVNFAFTNNSDEAANFLFSLDAQAFQSGIELDDMVIGVDGIDSSLTIADIQPGVTVTIQRPFLLRDDTTVKVEVREQFSFKDDIVASREFSVSR